MPARSSRSAIQRADGPTSTPVSTVAVNRPQSVGGEDARPASRPRAPDGSTVGGGSVNGTPRWAARSRATPRWHQASGRLRVRSRSNTTSRVTPSASKTGAPTRQARRQDQDAAVLVAQAELARRAEHAVRPLAPQLAPLDLQAVGHHGAERGQRHEVADRHVERAAADLQRLAVAGVDVDELDAIGLRVAAQRQHLGHDDAVDRLADDVDLLDGEAEAAHRVGQRVDGRSPSIGASSRSQDSRTRIRTAPGSGCRW